VNESWPNNGSLKYSLGSTATEEMKGAVPAGVRGSRGQEVRAPRLLHLKFFLRPHYQLKGLTCHCGLVYKLPSAKNKTGRKNISLNGSGGPADQR